MLRKYKWFKQAWRKINTKIRSGSLLATKDTEFPKWYLLLDPIFTEGVDNMIKLSSKADDIRSNDIRSNNSREDESGDSDTESDLSDSTSTSKSNVNKRCSSSASTASATDDTDSSDINYLYQMNRKMSYQRPRSLQRMTIRVLNMKQTLKLARRTRRRCLKLKQLQCGEL